MNIRIYQACAWSGAGFVALFAVGFIVAGFLPPPAPNDSAGQVAALFAGHELRIRAGLQIAWSSSLLFVPFVALLSQLMKQTEGEFAPMAYTQLAAGLGSTLVFVLPLMNLQAADYRPHRSPETVQALADLGWLPFVGAWAVPAAQSIALAVVTLQDQESDPVFPRWSGYFNIWVAVLYVPALFMPFFKSGILGWNGLLPFWLGAAAFFGWIVVMTALALRAIGTQARSDHLAHG
ncbi:hypothetical protein ACW2Q0_29860 [Nocardia sp. R16R-3T]